MFIEPPIGNVSSGSCDVHAESIGVKMVGMALEPAYVLMRGGPEDNERWDFLLKVAGEILYSIGSSSTCADLTDAILSDGVFRRTDNT